MGWSLGYDSKWNRDIGYGVPAYCDHPECTAEIDRGLAYVCCNEEPFGGEKGCGLYFCDKHLTYRGCERCVAKRKPFDAKPDHPRWVRHLLNDPSWAKWRSVNGPLVASLRKKHAAAMLAIAPEPDADPEDDP